MRTLTGLEHDAQVLRLAITMALDVYDATPLPHKSNVERAERIANVVDALGLLAPDQTLRTAIKAICARHEHGAARWAHPLPTLEWIAEVRAALDGSR